MSYLVLSRKYRPQKFDEVIGQNHVTQTLQNALKSERLSHAYILSGPRGVGKTTTARILAKSLNCTEGEIAEPCGTCEICKEITEGRSLDVLEIDGATYRGIDKIRDDLQDYLRHPPMKSKYKVVIIDEVHMLTKEAFNALLKTLEEPPPNVVFIFATTQPNKVPPTILSRCQRFDFKRIPSAVIIEALKEISAKESIKIDENSLILISRKADGGMRDALSLLDQVISFSNGDIEYESIVSMLGVVKEEVFFSITDLATTGNSEAAMNLVDDLMSQGNDPQTLVMGLLEHLRSLLIVHSAQSADLLESTKSIKELYLAKKDDLTTSEIQRMLKMAQDTLSEFSKSVMPRMLFEMLMINICNMDKSIEIESILNELGYSTEQKDEVQKDADSKNSESRKSKESNEVTSDTSPAADPVKRENKNESRNKNTNINEFMDVWRSIVAEVSDSRGTLGNVLKKAIPTAINGNYLELSFDQSDEYAKDSVEHNSGYIRDVMKKITDRDLIIKTALGEFKESKIEDIDPGESEIVSADEEISKNPTVEKIIDLFGGKLTL
ncbi:MAG: DNA polymerase III subunit gamma/tau [Candidatus Marinimicrobia bacterium]|nr:DNA polymerase III subunit gamma/tau [Candidatus Neomarinimicrobiota bacterium]